MIGGICGLYYKTSCGHSNAQPVDEQCYMVALVSLGLTDGCKQYQELQAHYFEDSLIETDCSSRGKYKLRVLDV